MEVSKDNRNRQIDKVSWVLAEESNQLNNLGEAKHEDDLGSQNSVPVVDIPTLSSPPA